MVFCNLGKLEEVNKKMKTILEKQKTIIQLKNTRTSADMSDEGKSEVSHNTSASKFDIKYSEVTDQLDKIFITTLITFHTDEVLTVETVREKEKE